MRCDHCTLAAVMACVLLAACHSETEVNLENPQVKAYLDQADYDVNDYSYCWVQDYEFDSLSYRRDQPAPVILRWESKERDSILTVTVSRDRAMNDVVQKREIAGFTSAYYVWNLIPGYKYYYKVESLSRVLAKGHFVTTGRRRMIYANSVHNVRDLGGLVTDDGRMLAYGKIYRGGRLTREAENNPEEDPTKPIVMIAPEDIRIFHDELNIRGEFDFRRNKELGYHDTIPENDIDFSPLGDDATFYNYQLGSLGGFQDDADDYCDMLRNILKHLRKGEAVYLHCKSGADRTGAASFLLEALAGATENELVHDYELTTFSTYGLRHRDGSAISTGLPELKALEGETLSEKAATFYLSAGITAEEIREYRSFMVQ